MKKISTLTLGLSLLLCAFMTDPSTNWNIQINKSTATKKSGNAERHEISQPEKIILFIKKTDILTASEISKYVGDMNSERKLQIINSVNKKVLYENKLSNTTLNSFDIDLNEALKTQEGQKSKSIDLIETTVLKADIKKYKICTFQLND